MGNHFVGAMNALPRKKIGPLRLKALRVPAHPRIISDWRRIPFGDVQGGLWVP